MYRSWIKAVFVDCCSTLWLHYMLVVSVPSLSGCYKVVLRYCGSYMVVNNLVEEDDSVDCSSCFQCWPVQFAQDGCH